MDNKYLETTNILCSKNKLSQIELEAIIQEYSPEAFFYKWCLELILGKYSLQRAFSQLIATYVADGFCMLNSYKLLRKTDTLYRSRHYEEKDAENKFCDQCGEEDNSKKFWGFPKEACGAPPSSKCLKAGRCNPIGLSLLYLANDHKTAIEEISPLVNEYISVAEFFPIRDLKIFNLSVNNFHIYDDTDKYRWLHSLIRQIEIIFQNPANESSNDEYKICQAVVEIFKELKFDGVAYSSSKASAFQKEALNYAIFDTELCEPVSSKLFKIADVKINYYPEKY